jgi:predicted adenine nucleotide alpha hydrolase (AANH) superfamily ATPase
MKILLHICCSNCAVYPVKMIRSEGHTFSGFWFNPNIHPVEEHELRLDSLKKLSDLWKFDMLPVDEYEPEKYFQMFEHTNPPFNKREGLSGNFFESTTAEKCPPLEKEDSGGFEIEAKTAHIPHFPERCRSCYGLRLEKTAEQARADGFEAFTTTLLISPYQDIEGIETIGKSLADTYNVEFHFRDFRPYFREAMNLSKELGLYRQKYCGCIFSREESEKARKARRAGKAGKRGSSQASK